MAALRLTTALSLERLGALFGGRDHGTVWSGVQRATVTPRLAADVAAVVAAVPAWEPERPVPVQYVMQVLITHDFGSPRMVQRTESTAS